MKVQLESTDELVELINEATGAYVPARVWQGWTEHGVPVVAFVTRIAPLIEEPVAPVVLAEFEADLRACRAPSPEARRSFTKRMVL